MLGDLAHMVERLLRMREALGSIPRISIFLANNNTFELLILFKGAELAIDIDRSA